MKCQCSGCGYTATHNHPNESNALFCKDHKEFGMVNLYQLKQLCIDCGLVRASINYAGETEGKYCTTCKKPGKMVLTIFGILHFLFVKLIYPS